MRTTVVNVRDCPESWTDDPSYVFVGREGPLAHGDYGNRHRVGSCFVCHRDHDRREAVRLHAEETRTRYAVDERYRGLIEKLRGKYLVCFCKKPRVEVPCHADVYVELLEFKAT